MMHTQSPRKSSISSSLLLCLLATGGVLAVLPLTPAHASSSSVGTTTNPYGLGYSNDDYTCGANGLFWVFYNNGTSWGWRSSTDGQTWSAFSTFSTAVPTPPGGTNDIGFFCNGGTSSVYYAGGKEDASENKFYYDSGTLNSDGSIAWGAETAVTTTGYADTNPSITLDSAGAPWVAVNTGDNEGHSFVEVWRDSSGWAQSLDLPTTGGAMPQIVPLTGGKMALLYGAPVTPSAMSTEAFDGSTWTSGPSTSAMGEFLYSAAVSIGDTVEACLADGTNVYYLSYAYGAAAWSSPVTIGPGLSCSAATDGVTTLGLFYVSSQTTLSYVQSNNAGSSFSSSTVVSSAESGVTFVGAGRQVSSDPAKQAVAVWLSNTPSSDSVKFANVSTAPVVQEQVTITNGTPSAPIGVATVSGCHTTVATIPMDGASHAFGADPSCSLTISVPSDTLYTRYRFPGASTAWTFTTGAGGTDIETNRVYYQFSVTASYSVTGVGSPAPPVLTSTQSGGPFVQTLTGTPTAYWLDMGASWSVPAALTSGATTWTTAPSSGLVSGPAILALVYTPPVMTTTTVTAVSTTITSTVTSTTTVTSLSTTTITVSTGQNGAPSASSLTCNQVEPQVGHRTQCTDVVYNADNGTALGNVTWTASGEGTFSNEQCSGQGRGGGNSQGLEGQQDSGDGQLQCQAQYAPNASGAQSLTATYSGDPYHSSSVGTVLIFVGNTSGSKMTATTLTCDQEYLPVGGSTSCQAVVTAANGGVLSGALSWSSTDRGTFSHVNCQQDSRKGQLQCSARYSAGSAGAQVVTATYSGDANHLSSSGAFEIFVSTSFDGARQAAVVFAGGSVVVVGLAVAVLEIKKDNRRGSIKPAG